MKTLGFPNSLSGDSIEPPAMISANERIAVDFSLTKQCTLMRAASFEDSKLAVRPDSYEVDACCGERMGPIAAQIFDTSSPLPTLSA